MTKTLLLTGATDGIGLETAKMLAPLGHTLLLHGRNPSKLEALAKTISAIEGAGEVKTYQADLSDLAEVDAFADAVTADVQSLDALINNAGVFVMSNALTKDGYDARFMVNTIAPYLLTRKLLPLMTTGGRVVNLSSAAQAPVSLDALHGQRALSDGEAYAQSKLAITMWSAHLAAELGENGPVVVAVNPASFLGSKMVKEAYGRAGHDLSIGADILVRAALSDEFAGASGRYYDNDRRSFSPPHSDAEDPAKCAQLVGVVEEIITQLIGLSL